MARKGISKSVAMDLKRMDEQLEPHITKLLAIVGDQDRRKPNKPKDDNDNNRLLLTEKGCRTPEYSIAAAPVNQLGRPKWELDPKKLTIKSIIGQGAYGFVYRGIYDGRDVAVKILALEDESKKAILEREFQQEVSVWYQLDHPNVAKLIGAVRKLSEVKIKSGHIFKVPPKNGSCIVVEYVAGGTLRSYLSKNRSKKLPMAVVIQFAIDVAKGLNYLHSNKIVHRDVKSENLLLDKSRRVKFIDFGVSRREAINQNEMTRGTGTMGYMAPEVYDGKAYDHKCDVYSFGICLWEIFCCAFPYPDQNPDQPQSSYIYMSRRPDIPSSCPSALANVMMMCWDSNPRNRPEMNKVVEMLEAIKTSDVNSQNLPRSCFPFLHKKKKQIA